MPAPLTKTCSMCGQTKRLSEFYENSTKPDHRSGICKECQKKVNNR